MVRREKHWDPSGAVTVLYRDGTELDSDLGGPGSEESPLLMLLPLPSKRADVSIKTGAQAWAWQAGESQPPRGLLPETATSALRRKRGVSRTRHQTSG
jgi:hypothetical protein